MRIDTNITIIDLVLCLSLDLGLFEGVKDFRLDLTIFFLAGLLHRDEFFLSHRVNDICMFFTG